MADTKVSALTDGATAAATDRIPAVRDPTGTPLNRYITPAYVKDYIIGLANTWTAAQTLTSAAPQLILGVDATTLGSIKMFGNTSGDVTLRPTAAAGTATTLTLPATTSTLAGLAIAQTFTATQTITPATEVSPLVLTGGSITGTTSTPLISATQTWNNAGLTATGLLINITNTSSNAASKLIDLQTGSTSMFHVTRGGLVNAAATGGSGNVTYGTTAQASTGLSLRANRADIAIGGAGIFSWSTTLAGVGSDKALGFWGSTSAHDGSAMSVGFYRNADGIMSLRASSTTTPASFNFYTYAASPPSAPSASMALLYADTSGGKIRLMALFPSGAAQQIAIEP